MSQYRVQNTQEPDLHPAMPDLHPALPGSVPSPDRNFLSCEVPVQSYLFRTTSPRRQKYYGFFFIHASSPTFHHIYFPYAVLRIFAGICRIIVRRLFFFCRRPADCLFYISFFHNDNSNTSQQHSVYYKNSCDNRKPFGHRHYLHSLEHCYRPIHRNHITVPDCIFNTMNNVKSKNQ